jgi:arylsulfatase A-like enzyme
MGARESIAPRLRLTLGILLAAGLVLAGWASAGAPRKVGAERAGPTSPPNILLIITDDQKDGMMRFMPRVRDAFADGVKYPNAFVTTPLCCPSRASIFSGRYFHNHRVNGHKPGEDRRFARRTFPRYLSAAGYHQAMFGKYINRWDVDVDGDAYFNKIDVSYPNDLARAEEWLSSQADDYLTGREAQDDRPWTLVLSTHAIHGPHSPEPEYQTLPIPPFEKPPSFKEKNLSDKADWTRQYVRETRYRWGGRTIQRRWRSYVRYLNNADELVGEVFGLIEELEEENTLAFFISDNGYLLGEHWLIGKNAPHIADLAVPLYARWPGVLEPTVDRRMVASIDLAPTIYEAAGIDPRYEPDARSLLSSHQRRFLIADNGAWRTIFSRRVQLIDFLKPRGREYYNLKRDPYELHSRPNRSAATRWHRRLNRLADCEARGCPKSSDG